MRILVLGSVVVRADGADDDHGGVNLGGVKSKTLLAALLTQPRHVVSISRLVDLIWDESPPRSATALVHTYVSQVRRGLITAGLPSALRTRAPGYLLDIDHAECDVTSFERHVDQARQAEQRDDYAEAIRHYEQGLALWRGTAFDGVDANFARIRAAGLVEERIRAEEGRARALILLGQPEEAVATLARLTTEHPVREPARALMMRALSLTGRQADALEAYREGRGHLMDQLGIEPGRELRELHATILGGSVEPAAPPPPQPPVAEPADVVPRLLPPDIGDFIGHEDQLARVLSVGMASHRTRPAVVVLSGFGGIGKSALAVHAAHRLRAGYPDGQLFADLRGTERDIGTYEVLGRLLGALGVPLTALPNSVEDRVDTYRRTVSGRKLVIVLDNAHGEHQVRGLLPGDPNCMVIITSRSRLTGLDGAEQVELGFLPQETSLRMLSRIVGDQRIGAEPWAAQTIAKLCGGVPLAIRVAAAKLLARPHWPMRALASRLSDEQRRLDELSVGDLAIRTSLRLHYAELDDPHRRAFHLLTLLDLPDFGSWLAAPLLDVSLDDAEDVVEHLVDLRLLDVVGVDLIGRVRYRFHDLVQLFGAELARSEEPGDAVVESVRRTLATWTALVEAGSRGLPQVTLGLRPPIPVRAEPDARLIAEVEDAPSEWLRSETRAVVRAVERAHDLGVDGATTAQIASLLSSSFAAHNEFASWQRTNEAALAGARRSGHLKAEAIVLAGLGQLYCEKDDFDAAFTYFRDAADLATATGDDATLAVALVGTGIIRHERTQIADAQADLRKAIVIADRTGDRSVPAAASYRLAAIVRDHSDVTEAADMLTTCVELYRELGDHRGEGLAVRGLSLCSRALDDYDEAAVLSERAKQILAAAGDALGTTYAMQSLAKARIRQGRLTGVAEMLDESLRMCIDQADRFGVALITRTLGELALAEGALDRARDLLRTALDRWTDLGLLLWQARTLRDLAAAESSPDLWLRAITLFEAASAREGAELAALTPAAWLTAVRR